MNVVCWEAVKCEVGGRQVRDKLLPSFAKEYGFHPEGNIKPPLRHFKQVCI